MTLQDLSDMAGVSVSYLSQIERDHVTPTLGTLAQIGRSLGVGLDYFVAMPTVSDSLVRAEDRRRFSLDGATQAYEKIGADIPTHEMSAFMIYVPPGYRSETVSHEGEEFIHVMDGRDRLHARRRTLHHARRATACTSGATASMPGRTGARARRNSSGSGGSRSSR